MQRRKQHVLIYASRYDRITSSKLLKEWIQKTWYNYTMEYYSAIKNNEFMKFFMQMDGTRKYHPE